MIPGSLSLFGYCSVLDFETRIGFRIEHMKDTVEWEQRKKLKTVQTLQRVKKLLLGSCATGRATPPHQVPVLLKNSFPFFSSKHCVENDTQPPSLSHTCVYVYLIIPPCLSIHLPVNSLCIVLSFYLSLWSICSLICLFCLSVLLFICLSVYLLSHFYVHPFLLLSIHPSIHPPTFLSVNPGVLILCHCSFVIMHSQPLYRMEWARTVQGGSDF